jgi:hypothetical protein
LTSVRAALALATRSKLLAGARLLSVRGDGFLNSAITVSEHLVALLVGAATSLFLTRSHLHPNAATGRRYNTRPDCKLHV